jgi:cytochrome c2
MVPGTKMALDGLDDPQQRADIIAYLKQFNQDGTTKK